MLRTAMLLLLMILDSACGPTPPDQSAIPPGSTWWCETDPAIPLGRHACYRSASSCPGGSGSGSCGLAAYAWCVTFPRPVGNVTAHECFTTEEDCDRWHAETCGGSMNCSLCGAVGVVE